MKRPRVLDCCAVCVEQANVDVSEAEKKAVGVFFQKDLKRKGRVGRGAHKPNVVFRGNKNGGTVDKDTAKGDKER